MERLLLDTLGQLASSDFFVTITFWCAFALVAVVFRVVPEKSRLKLWILLGSSIAMLLMLPRFTTPLLFLFLGVCGFTFLIGHMLNHPDGLRSQQVRKAVAGGSIVVLVLVLAFFKYRIVQNAALSLTHSAFRGSDLIFLIGISYSSFKAIHFILEAYKKKLKKSGLLEFLNYMLFFPSFISGPINRYNHFIENSAFVRNSRLREDLKPGLVRIIHGLFKKTVLATVLFPYTLAAADTHVLDMSPGAVLIGLYIYTVYFYCDFSGYTDLAIGTARIMGFVLPENFDFPFLKKNIQQLWANWHISLSSWLTDYVYWPLVHKMRGSNWLRKHPLLVSNIAILLTFFICGIWHGEGINFVLWGLYQGVGIVMVNIYQNWKRKVRDPKALAYFRSSVSHYAGVVMTFNFFSAGLLFFVVEPEEVARVWELLI